uniref:Smr domain-containing protein n=1 Tax=Meloidogyne javanica TaxID=6303 RepID=A0A915MPD6_MELJA
MQKNLFNCEEIGQAILAAAKNNEHFLATKRKEEEEKIDEENNENKINNEEEFLLDVNNDDGENTSNFLIFSVFSVIPTKNQKKKLIPTNNNALIKLSALTTLYEVFPDVPPKTIKHFAKENGYNFELTANCLLNISESFDSKLDLISTEEQLEEQQNSINIIVPSKNPNIIIPYGAPPPNKKGEDGGKLGDLSPSLNFNDSLQTISQLLEQLDFERRHCLSMANQVRGKPHGGALCGHYMRRAGTLRQEQLRLTYQNDRLNAWNCPNDCFIDLHGMNWKRAVEFVKYKIDLCRETMPNLRKLHVITGYGSTSGHLSVIRQKLQKFLSNNGIDFCISPQNQGVVEIRLQGIRQRLSGVD